MCFCLSVGVSLASEDVVLTFPVPVSSLYHLTEADVSLANKMEILLPLMTYVSVVMWRRDGGSRECTNLHM